MGDAIAEVGKAWIVGLPVDEAVVDLLNDDGNLEEREHFEEAQPGQVAPASRGVTIDDLAAREVALARGDRRQRIALTRWRVRHPVREEDAEIDQRVAKRAHL